MFTRRGVVRPTQRVFQIEREPVRIFVRNLFVGHQITFAQFLGDRVAEFFSSDSIIHPYLAPGNEKISLRISAKEELEIDLASHRSAIDDPNIESIAYSHVHAIHARNPEIHSLGYRFTAQQQEEWPEKYKVCH
jgi:hypothetical protein